MNTTRALIILAVGVAGALACAWQLRQVGRSDDYRTRNDRVAAERILRVDPPTETQAPGTDSDLLLDCIAICPELAELDPLRDAINQHRKENPQP